MEFLCNCDSKTFSPKVRGAKAKAKRSKTIFENRNSELPKISPDFIGDFRGAMHASRAILEKYSSHLGEGVGENIVRPLQLEDAEILFGPNAGRSYPFYCWVAFVGIGTWEPHFIIDN